MKRDAGQGVHRYQETNKKRLGSIRLTDKAWMTL